MIALTSKTFSAYLTDVCHYRLTDGNIDINDASFDGWVIPNGKTFTCARENFKAACEKYSPSKSPDATVFTVPNLNGHFFCCNPGA